MNTQQLRAMQRPRYFAFEVLSSKFGRRKAHHSEVLTVNAGYE